MKTGLFFGSFNPVHIGHIAIAGYMANFTDLKEVWMVVSPQNPLKKKETLLEDHHRFRLTEIAAESVPGLKVSNIEFKLERPSYTINTLAHLSEKYPSRKFCLIMGSDNLATLSKWKNHERILEGYPIYVYPRPGYDAGPFKDHPGVTITESPMMEISSSFIRNAIRKKKETGFLMPPGVYDYIREMHFYE